MKNVSKKIGEIAELCAELSVKTKDHYFFNYAPHVNTIDVRVHIGGWIEGIYGFPVYPCENINGLIRLGNEEMINGVIAELKSRLPK